MADLGPLEYGADGPAEAGRTGKLHQVGAEPEGAEVTGHDALRAGVVRAGHASR